VKNKILSFFSSGNIIFIRKKISKSSPSRIILISILLTITLGTLALGTPWARTGYVSWLDLFFTSTSCTCVTGLFPFVGLANFTRIGHIILMILMQVGALGLVTFTMFFISLFIKPGLTTSLITGQVMEIATWQNMRKLLIFVVIFVFTVEFIGAGFMLYELRHDFAFSDACFVSLFHAVSSFCNAPGIGALHFKDYCMFSYASNTIMLMTTSILLTLGGLGFFVWHAIYSYIVSLRAKRRYMWSLHSKVVLYATAIIIFSAAILIFFLEKNSTMANLGFPYKIMNSLLHATASRSSGVVTVVDILEFNMATLLSIMIISFIGSAPGGSGSGVKVTTIAIFFAAIKSTLKGRSDIEILGRKIPEDQVYKAIAIIFLGFIWILLSTFLLAITESGRMWNFLDLIFESISAFGNIGLSTGITPTLSALGKVIIIIGMIIGRIGGLTLVLSLMRIPKEQREFAYPEERIALG